MFVIFQDRQVLPTLLAVLLFTSLLSVATSSATTVQEHWKAPTPTKSGQIGIFYDDPATQSLIQTVPQL
ncbi:MAG: hypothetical protein EBX97_00515 [Actinobacteria bacterium]|nr:hypothetical protein [Actinomycetota bacterium]